MMSIIIKTLFMPLSGLSFWKREGDQCLILRFNSLKPSLGLCGAFLTSSVQRLARSQRRKKFVLCMIGYL